MRRHTWIEKLRAAGSAGGKMARDARDALREGVRRRVHGQVRPLLCVWGYSQTSVRRVHGMLRPTGQQVGTCHHHHRMTVISPLHNTHRWTLMQPPDGVVDDADHDGADAGVAVGGFGEHDNENNDEDDDDEGEGDGDGAAVAAASAAGVVLSAVDETVARAGLRTDRDQARPLGSRSLAMHLRRASHQMFPIL